MPVPTPPNDGCAGFAGATDGASGAPPPTPSMSNTFCTFPIPIPVLPAMAAEAGAELMVKAPLTPVGKKPPEVTPLFMPKAR